MLVTVRVSPLAAVRVWVFVFAMPFGQVASPEPVMTAWPPAVIRPSPVASPRAALNSMPVLVGVAVPA